jgi:N-acetylglucosaminyldiphosphoundecaprenol N-acetyl-beta-D-mannosaminyltransferase
VSNQAVAREECDLHGGLDLRPVVNGLRIDPILRTELLARIEGLVHCGRTHVIHFCATYATVLGRKDERYRQTMNAGDLNVPDGAPIAWTLRASGLRTDRIAGSDAMEMLLEEGVLLGFRHYILGGRPEVVRLLEEHLPRRFPGVRIVRVRPAPFRRLEKQELAAINADIEASGADLVWLGQGTPLQDELAEELRQLGSAPVILCVGAAFDFVAGAKKRAPAWLQALGFEWLHRVVCEPRRLWRRYLLGNPQFVFGLLAERLCAGRRGGS